MVYNCRLYNFPTGQHVTFYKQSISKTGEKKEKLSKTYQNEERKEEIEKHCQKTSLSHTKNKIYQISRSVKNWEWFITLTFDRTKIYASDYDEVVEKISTYLYNIRRRKAPNMKYLIVPELHSDKKHYHFHGLLSDCGDIHFRYSGKNDRKSGQPIFNILDWTLGFTTATRVQDTQKVSSYITKYVTKNIGGENYLKNKKRYYASQNINVVEPEYFVLDEEEFQEIYKSNITYCKTVNVVQAHQQITYYELKY